MEELCKDTLVLKGHGPIFCSDLRYSTTIDNLEASTELSAYRGAEGSTFTREEVLFELRRSISSTFEMKGKYITILPGEACTTWTWSSSQLISGVWVSVLKSSERRLTVIHLHLMVLKAHVAEMWWGGFLDFFERVSALDENKAESRRRPILLSLAWAWGKEESLLKAGSQRVCVLWWWQHLYGEDNACFTNGLCR